MNIRIRDSKLEFINILWFSITILLSSISLVVRIQTRILLVIGVILALTQFVIQKTKINTNLLGYIIYIIILTILLFYGVTYSNAPEYGLEKSEIFAFWTLYFALTAITIARNPHFFIRVNVIIGTLFLFFLILKFGDPIHYLQNASNSTRLGEDSGSDDSELNDPIWIARYLGFYMIMLLCSNSNTKRIFIFKCLFLLIAFSYIITTGSKGPIIALVVAMALKLRREQLIKYLAGGTVIITILILIAPLLIANNDFLRSRFLDSNSVDSRNELQGTVLQSFGDFSTMNYFFGRGTGEIGYVLTGFDERAYPHNILIELAYENGLLAIFIFSIVILLAAKRIIKIIFSNDVYGKIFCILFIYFLLNAQFSGDITVNEFLFASFLWLISYNKIMYINNERFIYI
jgi:hypothetical protein